MCQEYFSSLSSRLAHMVHIYVHFLVTDGKHVRSHAVASKREWVSWISFSSMRSVQQENRMERRDDYRHGLAFRSLINYTACPLTKGFVLSAAIAPEKPRRREPRVQPGLSFEFFCNYEMVHWDLRKLVRTRRGRRVLGWKNGRAGSAASFGPSLRI